MSDKLKIGIVGCGAIGTSLAQAIVFEFSDKAELNSLYDLEIKNTYKLANRFNSQKLPALNLEDLINKVDLVIEATKVEAAFDIAKKALSATRDIMVMSVGGIVKNYRELAILAEEKGCHMFVPSGAILGIDGLKAASCGKISKVTLTTKKPPKAFLGVPYVLKRKVNLNNLNEDIVLFEGDAISAIKAFPQNVNVAATLSIAGIGAERTAVRIIASPFVTINIHEIEIESEAGKLFTRAENVLHPDNPKTSFLAVLSAVATLKQILEPIKIGT